MLINVGCKWGWFVCADCIRLCTCCNASLWLGGQFGGCWSTSSSSTSCLSSKGAACTLSIIMSSKMPSAVDAMFSCTGIFASFSKMSSSEATSNCSASGSALTKSDSLMPSYCSWRSVSGDAKLARRKHLSMVSSPTLFQALLIHRMVSKTVTDFADSVAVLNFPTAASKLCSIDFLQLAFIAWIIPWSNGCNSYVKCGGKNLTWKLLSFLETTWLVALSTKRMILLFFFFIVSFNWFNQSSETAVVIHAFLLCFHVTGRLSGVTLFCLKARGLAALPVTSGLNFSPSTKKRSCEMILVVSLSLFYIEFTA